MIRQTAFADDANSFCDDFSHVFADAKRGHRERDDQGLSSPLALVTVQ